MAKPTTTKNSKSAAAARSAKPAVTAKSVQAKPGASSNAKSSKPAPKAAPKPGVKPASAAKGSGKAPAAAKARPAAKPAPKPAPKAPAVKHAAASKTAARPAPAAKAVKAAPATKPAAPAAGPSKSSAKKDGARKSTTPLNIKKSEAVTEARKPVRKAVEAEIKSAAKPQPKAKVTTAQIDAMKLAQAKSKAKSEKARADAKTLAAAGATPKSSAIKVGRKSNGSASDVQRGNPAEMPAPAPEPISAPARRTYIPQISHPLGTYGGVLLAENPKPFPKKSPYTKAELNKLLEAMLEERADLRRELGRMDSAAMGSDGGQENQGHSLHIAEHASDLQATENLLGVREMTEERLAQVEEAVQKLRESQNYGLCVACGNKLGIERLIAKPHAHLCKECQVKFEKRRPRG